MQQVPELRQRRCALRRSIGIRITLTLALSSSLRPVPCLNAPAPIHTVLITLAIG